MLAGRPDTATSTLAPDIADAPGDDAPGNDVDDAERGPHRRCIVTRTQGERERMIRFVVAPDRGLVPDLAARLPGRGIWLSARGDVLETARARNAFAKAARGPVTVPPDLPAMVLAGLHRRIADTLGLARRAGQAVSGFDKAREWLTAGRAGLVVQAGDGSPDEAARFLGGWDGPVARPLSAEALGMVFGRDRAVHVAVTSGRLAGMVIADTERLAGLSGQPHLVGRAGR